MRICFEINKKPKPKPPELSERWFVETYEGKPRFVVTDKDMYNEGYVQAGRVGGYKRWELNCTPSRDRILVEVRKGGKDKWT